MKGNTVTPNIEHVPERVYKQRGKVIECFSIPDYQKPREHGKTPIFTIEVEHEDHASALMQDLYYGEYTGA